LLIFLSSQKGASFKFRGRRQWIYEIVDIIFYSEAAGDEKAKGLILVTQNSADFKKFSKLQLENWHRK